LKTRSHYHLEAVRRLSDALTSSEIGPEIAKIVWFGSTSKGSAREDSDIDVLIVTTDGDRTRERIADILMDVQMETRAPLEIVTCHLDDLFPLVDHFLENVLSHGQEVYSMPERVSRISAASHCLALAQEYHDSAKEAISRGHYRLGLDGAYNSAELAVKGLLVVKMADLPGSHGGIIQRFGETYIRTGSVERAIGRRLNLCLELRNSARYKFSSRITGEDAGVVLTLAGELIALLERELSGQERL